MWFNYLLIGLGAGVISCIFTPFLIRWVTARRVIDYPRPGKIHARPTPLMGGLAVAAGFFLATAVAFLLSRRQLLGSYDTHYLGIVLGGLIIIALGVWDDLKGVKAPVKVLVQILAAAVLVACGYRMDLVSTPFGAQINLGFWGSALIIIWVVGVTNAFNLLDGLDGLASGVTVIAGLTIFFVSQEGPPFVPVISIALAAASLGFLPYNRFPARIFLGDTGSLFAGFILAAVSVEGSFKTATGIALMVPLVALAVPLADTGAAFLRRCLHGKNPLKGDRRHVHHFLLALGYSPPQAVRLLYLICLDLGGIALIMKYAGRSLAMGMLVLLGLMLYIFSRLIADFRFTIIGWGGR